MSRYTCVVIAATLALAGCDLANKQDAQYDDSRNPFYKKAQQDLETSPEAAVADYEAALAANPKLSGAHYQLGHLYAEKLNDPIGSIFHFQQYLKIDPNGSKADEAKALIDKESQAFAASLPNSPTQSADDYAKLQADNASLRKQVEDATRTIVKLQGQLKHHHDAVATATGTTTTSAPVAIVADAASNAPAAAAPVVAAASEAATNAVSAAPPRALPLDAPVPAAASASGTNATAAPAGPGRTYKVVSGDSLWKIAHKMYPGDTKNGIDKIKDANKDVLIEGKPLKIGQVLIIPD